MLKAFKLRLYPNRTQKNQIDISINHCRFLWNVMLEMQNVRYKNNKNAKFINTFGMNLLIPSLKRDFPWLKEADSTALQETNSQLDTAFQRFFKKLGRHPVFKSYKFSRKSYTTKMGMSLIDETHLRLAKVGDVYFKAKALPLGKIKRVTVSISATGKYHALVLVDCEIKPFAKTNSFVGLDFGLTHLAIQSDGYKLPNIRFDKKLAKKKHFWEKRLSRRRIRALSIIHEQKKIGRDLQLSDFSNYMRAKYNVAKINEKIANQRNDYLQKYTTKWYGKELLVIDPKYTTQVDFETGEIQKHPLSERMYTNGLGHLVDRDVNASKNILQWAMYPDTRVTKA